MSEIQSDWINCARTLQLGGMNKGVAFLLEEAGPLCVLFAQLVYLSQPLFSGVLSSHSMEAIARVLEDTQSRQKFIGTLREGKADGSNA